MGEMCTLMTGELSLLFPLCVFHGKIRIKTHEQVQPVAWGEEGLLVFEVMI